MSIKKSQAIPKCFIDLKSKKTKQDNFLLANDFNIGWFDDAARENVEEELKVLDRK